MIAAYASHIVDAPPPNCHLEVRESAISSKEKRVSIRPTNSAATSVGTQVVLEGIRATNPSYKLDSYQSKIWTKQNERRFLDLARKEALDSIIPSEVEELEHLERERNALNSKRSYKQILASKKQFEKAEKLITALHEYLETTH